MATDAESKVVGVERRVLPYTICHEWRGPVATTEYADLLRQVADHVEEQDGVLLDLSIHWRDQDDELVLRAYIEDENNGGCQWEPAERTDVKIRPSTGA